MRKWTTNYCTLRSQWVAEGFETHPVDTVSLGTDKIKILGIIWVPENDCLTIETKGLLDFISGNNISKRSILQTIGKMFDPLGLLTPFTIRVKCLIQDLWDKKFTWDENLPPKLEEKWKVWCK